MHDIPMHSVSEAFAEGAHGPEWVIVRAVRGLGDPPGPPARLDEIARGCAATGCIGHLAEVYVLSARGRCRATSACCAGTPSCPSTRA